MPAARENAERPRLSKAAVVDCAIAIGDAEGVEAVTIRRLAGALGVTPMALYWHFRTKEELLAGLADRIWSQVDINVDGGANWPDQLRSVLESVVRVLRAHPCASSLLLEGDKRTSEAAQVAVETTLEVLHRGGFSPAYAVAIARSALLTSFMLARSEPGRQPGLSEAERAERQRQARVRLTLLPPGRFPRLIEAAGPLTATDDPGFHYRIGIDLFIGGVQAMAARSGPGRSAPQVSQHRVGGKVAGVGELAAGHGPAQYLADRLERDAAGEADAGEPVVVVAEDDAPRSQEAGLAGDEAGQ